MDRDKSCPCCGARDLTFIGTKTSKLDTTNLTTYRYWLCQKCFYRFQGNPNTNFEELYNEDYYQGRGADKFVDYEFELSFPNLTVRNLEFEGILQIVESHLRRSAGQKNVPELNWLDFGCGNGAFVNYLNSHSQHKASGYDIGFAANEGKKSGVNILEFENLQEKYFDVITAVEVLEHTDDPFGTIERIYQLLKPGGLFFYTTGNSRPFSRNFLEWRYVAAVEVHIGFFEPQTIEKLFHQIGFKVVQNEELAGWAKIYKYKVLKNLNVKKRRWSWLLPALSPTVKILDRKFQLMAMPAGMRPID
jgi:2-polyprenyl-3-methyl-5-hydroxy-6-metoxy-1,4-benzoquinol methylase